MRQKRYSRLNQKEKKKIVEMYDSGDWKVPELSEMFRVTKRRIYQIVNEANVNLLMYGEKDGSEE
jgi:predicted DNA-binding protein YlxM (UPF0122 family)|tara:strand:+ start:7276 stop:7470 length:195 start_codon:yes stop_codon:yes gene_type:complete